MMIVIPAYQPDEKLAGVVDALIQKTDFPIVIVDDGSREDCQPLFAALAEKDRVTVLHHEVNRGKGAAMKTAFQYVYDHCPDEEGVITVDADGQHLPDDVLRVADTFRSNRNALVTGSRRFTGNVPFKSRAGNAITRFVFAISTGVKVYDTQTGLRAFSHTAGARRFCPHFRSHGHREVRSFHPSERRLQRQPHLHGGVAAGPFSGKRAEGMHPGRYVGTG